MPEGNRLKEFAYFFVLHSLCLGLQMRLESALISNLIIF